MGDAISRDEMKAKLANKVEVTPAQDMAWRKDPSKRPRLEDGKFWSDTAGVIENHVLKLYRPAPGVILSLKDQSSLDEIAGRIVSMDDVKDKSCDALSRMYEPNSSEIDKLAKRSVQIADDIKNEKILGLDKSSGIDRKAAENQEQAPQL